MSASSEYATGSARERIERALQAAGKSVDSLDDNDLAPIEHFHTLGLRATESLMQLAGITAEDRVLDAGGDIGGSARFLARQIGCRVTSIDFTREYSQRAPCQPSSASPATTSTCTRVTEKRIRSFRLFGRTRHEADSQPKTSSV